MLLSLAVIAAVSGYLFYSYGLPLLSGDAGSAGGTLPIECRSAGNPEAATACRDARSILAAERSAEWAKWQVVFGALGVAGLLVTLLFNCFGLLIAFKATRDTETALAIAQSQLEVAQDTARQQLRAYLAVRSFVLIDCAPTKAPRVNFIICNDGDTPAYDVAHIGTMCLTPIDPNRAKFKLPKIRPHENDLGPGRDLTMGYSFRESLTQAEYDDVVAGRQHIVVRGYIRYYDVFNRLRRLTYRLCLEPGDLSDPEVRLGYCRRNNEQT
jgi:hypothetical protein